MTNKIRLSGLFLILLYFCLVTATTALAQSTRIFILHSYHQEYPWTNTENKGFTQTLNDRFVSESINFSTEYLDTKRVEFNKAYQEFFYRYLKEKYDQFLPDVVFCSDDDALVFLIRFKARLFGDVPVVFCGVNNFDIQENLNRQYYTGVFEKKEIIPNLKLLNGIFPRSKTILFLGDNSPTHRAIEQTIKVDIASQFPEQQHTILANDKLSYLVKQLKIYKQGLIFLTTIGGIKDEHGNVVSLKKALSAIVSSGDFRIISMEDAYLQKGIFGGYVTNGFYQGKAAAELTAQIIQGNTPLSIPLVKESPNQYMFNYPQLKKFGITISQLPEKKIILNTPHSFYLQYKYRIWSAVFFLIIQMLVILVLIQNIHKRKKAESALQKARDGLENKIIERTSELTKTNTNLNNEINERKQTQDILDSQNQLMSTLLENLQVGVFMVAAPAGKPLLANRRALEMLGRGIMGDADKSTLAQVYQAFKSGTNDIYPENQLPIVRCLNGEEHSVDDIVVVQPDGNRINLEVFGTPVKDKKGNVVASLVSFSDITEHKQSEKKIKLKVTQLEMIYEIAHIISGELQLEALLLKIVKTVQNNFDYHNVMIELVNEEAGCMDVKAVAGAYADFFPHQHMKIGEGMTGRAAATGEPQISGDVFQDPRYVPDVEETRSELAVPIKKGRKTIGVIDLQSDELDAFDESDVMVIETLADQVAVAIENAKLFRSVQQELSQRKQIERELKKSEERYREYFEENISGTYISSPEGQLIACNKEYMRIFNLEDIQQGLGIPISSFYKDPNDRVKFLNLLKKEKRVTGYAPNLKKIDGTPIHLIENASGVFDENGNLKHIRGFLLDVTKQKKLETLLQQAQKMESIGTLAGGIAHDFNNILSPIVGHTEMMLEDVPEDSPFRNGLNQIYTGALRARDLVKQILTFSRQDTNELMLMKLQPIIKEALKLIRSTIPTTIDIKQYIKNDCGVIKADPTQIHQIVMNLATNSYHAMQDTGGELKVSLKEVELGKLDLINPDMTPGVYACLTVADTGIGMDKVLTEKIFDPFFTTKAIGKGTGMGLSVVHGIVSVMGGYIQVYSKPGKGTQFHVYLPVEKSLSEKQEINSKAEIQGGIEQILLVDDEEVILKMEKRILERLGYQITSRSSSLEALETFRADPDKFDLIITDMAMPNMRGDKLSAELIKIRPDIPLLLCTGFSEAMSEEKATSLGIKGFLMKPIVMKDLAQKIREVLDEN
jgi:PAS domain S-box-containing protein